MIPSVGAHLWQSTIFAGAAFLAALALRKNRAGTRYGVWFAASAKFLIPFSWLVRLGTLMPHRAAAPAIPTVWISALQEVSQPLALPAVAPHSAITRATDYGQLAAFLLWAFGFAAVAICWTRQWRRARAMRKSARPVSLAADLAIPVPVLAAPGLMEPGVFGILRPVLLLPDGIAERLTSSQLDAILAHELAHLRRKDNLTAAIHMAVQAVFWFHPLTWWIGSRLIGERERACDEEVLRRGYKSGVYAESILTVCRWYLSSPLACVAGVTGSDLKKRIEAIMRSRNIARLSAGKKLALAAAAFAAIAVPVAMGILTAPASLAQDVTDWQAKAGGKMSFEVASVKLSQASGPPSAPTVNLNAGDSYHPTNYFHADFPLWSYIQFAYKLWWPSDEQQREIARLPKWVTDRYIIDARAAGNPTKDQMRLMMQSLLAERFKLAAHFESREVPVYILTLIKPGKLGPKLIPHAEGRACDASAADPGPVPARVIQGEAEPGPENFPPMCDTVALIRRQNHTNVMGYRNATMEMIAGSLSGTLFPGRVLVDRTGLSGRFDFTLTWAPDPTGPPPSDASPAPAEPGGPSPFQALREQLGIKAEPSKAPVPILVVDRVERPSEN